MNTREHRLAVVALSLVGIIAAWKLVASPILSKAGQLRARAALARAAIEVETALAERAEAIKAKDAQIVSVKNVLDVGGVEAAFLELVNRCAGSSGLRVSSERPSNSVHASAGGRGAYAQLQVALTGEGTLEAVVAFLEKLASDQRPLRVMTASLSRTDRAGVLAVNMRLSTVAVKEDAK